MKQCTKLVFVLFLFMLAFSSVSYGQVGDPGCDPACNCRADMSVCPIDSGLLILMLIGVAYGIKKYRDTKRTSVSFDNAVSD